MMSKMELVLLFGLLAIGLGAADHNFTLKHQEIFDFLREHSEPDVIPIDQNDPRPVEVLLELSLLNIGLVEKPRERLEMVVRHKYMWQNKALKWEESDASPNVTVPLRYIWWPRTTLVSSVDVPRLLSPELALVASDGGILYETQEVLVIYAADLAGAHFGSGATVSFTYRSANYDNTQLTFAAPTAPSFVADDFKSKKFSVTNLTVEKSTFQPPTTSAGFEELTFSFNLKST